jgi:type II secretory pathway component GspD/PulD (secretin)
MAGTNQPDRGVTTNNAAAGTGSNISQAPAGTNDQPVAAAGSGVPSATAQLPIQFQDVPITTAIESLARLAGINYLLDPKIGYGQPDDKGQIKPEPTLSIRWESVTAEQALLALLDNYGLQLVENPKTGIYKITTKDPTARPEMITRVVQLKYASTSNMMAAVVSTLTDTRSKVVPDPRTSQLVVVATENEQADVTALVNQLDKPTRQVLIETKLVELSSNPSTSKGVDWSGTLQAQNVAFGNGVLSQSSSASTVNQTAGGTTTVGAGGSTFTTPAGVSQAINNTVTTTTSSGGGLAGLAMSTASGLTADGLKAVLSFLNQSSEAQVVSTPRVVTLDNETATISVTRAFPIMNITAGTANTTGGSSITYSNLGTILMVTPRISANDSIWLKVSPTVSSYFGQDKQTINGVLNTADIFDLRSIDTQVLIPNAHTLVMGGLVQDNPNASYTKVPILGDIPFLGVAFRSENNSMTKDNLLIFITPTIVKDADFKPSNNDFLNSQARYMKDSLNMHTWLDSAQPRGNWSNPLPDQDVKTPSPDEGKAAFAP